MMIREQIEAKEALLLSDLACASVSSQGRAREEAECAVRTCFQRDIDRIIHSKAFRRLKHKTQVFLQPEGDHYRTRMTHTLEVSVPSQGRCRSTRIWQRPFLWDTTWATRPLAMREKMR